MQGLDIPDYLLHKQAFGHVHPNIKKTGLRLWRNRETEAFANRLRPLL
jgi:hypothetical protein